MSGGKGGQTETTSTGSQTGTSTTQLDPILRQAAIENLNLANEVGSLGYIPYQGPTVAGFSQPQVSAMQNTDAAARAFGLPGGSVLGQSIASGGQPTSVAGFNYGQSVPGMGGNAYSPYQAYMAALQNIPQGQADFIKQFFIDPTTGAAPTRGMTQYDPMSQPVMQQAAAPAAPAAYSAPASSNGDRSRQENAAFGNSMPYEGNSRSGDTAGSFLGGIANSVINSKNPAGAIARAVASATVGGGNPAGRGAVISSKAPPSRPSGLSTKGKAAPK
tara:strand:+ start:455 stop:1276 length:822 start_codon:yes stop_codon:yes gene_type:complete